MTFDIRSPAVYAPPAYPPKIGKPCSATPTIRWRVITRVPTSVACSNRRISYSIGAERRPCYAWPTVTLDGLRESNSNEEDLVLRAKCMNLDAVRGTGGQLVRGETVTYVSGIIRYPCVRNGPLKFGAPGRI